MLAKRIIPCLDVKEGRVVKGTKFLELKDAGDPVQNAVYYNQAHADELIFLDITASHEKRDILLNVVEKTASEIFMPLTVGGGVRNVADIRSLLLSGADKVSINTAAIQQPELLSQAAEKFGSQCIVAAIDAKKNNRGSWDVFTHGGRIPTGRDVIEWARECVRRGAGEILLTSMDRDGTRCGYDLDLTRAVSQSTEVPVIASGGAGNLTHLAEALREGCADAVLAASIFHYREYTIDEAKAFLRLRNICVRN